MTREISNSRENQPRMQSATTISMWQARNEDWIRSLGDIRVADAICVSLLGLDLRCTGLGCDY